MQKKHIILTIGLLVLVCVTFWFIRPSPSYDLNRVEPRLRALQQPYQRVKTAYYLDGGSIGIEVIDHDGRHEQFAIPAHLGDTNRYTTVFVGAMYDRKPGAVAVSDSVQTKRMLIDVLAAMPHREPYDNVCLMLLRRRPADYVHCLFLKITGQFDRAPKTAPGPATNAP